MTFKNALTAAAAALALFAGSHAGAQGYPTKPVKIIV